METMKSMFFACALLLGSAETFSAENLVLSEDFESQTFPPSGWVVKGTESVSYTHLRLPTKSSV